MPELRLDREKWKLRGACYQSFDLRFFGSRDQRRATVAEYCTNCSVKVECRLARRVSNGAWGGNVGKAW